MTEMIDIFNANHELLGTFDRKAAHSQGLWHQTFHCWITWQGHMILQLRAPGKKSFPNMLDISAAGHLAAGETPEDGVREIEEELGIKVARERLVYLGIKHDIMDEEGGVRNREFAHVYMLESFVDIHSMRLAKDEVAGLVQMKIHDMIRLFAGEVPSVRASYRLVTNSGEELGERTVVTTDLIPRVDGYYYKMAIMADLMAKGYPHLCV